MIFYKDKKTQYYEDSGKWLESITYIDDKWNHERNNISLFLKYSVTIWYTLTLDGPELSLTPKEYSQLTDMLYNNYEYFISMFFDDCTCQWIFGYMMTVRTDLFLGFNLAYGTIEKTGENLIKKASERGNMIAKLLSATKSASKKEIYEYRTLIKEHIHEDFDESQEIDKYFIQMLTRDFK